MRQEVPVNLWTGSDAGMSVPDRMDLNQQLTIA